MRIIVNKTDKKIYLFDLLILVITIALVGGLVYVLTNPVRIQKQNRDNLREKDMEAIFSMIKDQSTKDDSAKLERIKLCAEDFDTIGDTINYDDFLDDPTSKPKDPQSNGSEVKYSICRSEDGKIFQIKAPSAEMKPLTKLYKL